MEKKSNKELTIEMNKKLTSIHRSISQILPIDTQIRASIGNHKNYTNAELMKLNLTMLLEYSNHLIGQIKETLKSLRWVKTHTFWSELRKYEKTFTEIKDNVKVDMIQIKGTDDLLYNLVQLREDLKDNKQDFEMETRKTYLKYLGTPILAFTTLYVGFYGAFKSIFGSQTIAFYIFIVFFISASITIYFYPKIFSS